MKRTLICVALLASLVAAVPATAERPAGHAERQAIASAVHRFLAASGSPAAHDVRVTRVVVSSRSAHWARADVTSKAAGAGMAALRRRDGRWNVMSLGTAGVECGIHMPKAVQKELFGSFCPPGAR